MSASKWIFRLFLLTFFPNSAAFEVKEVKAGDDVVLRCWGTRDAANLMLKRIRPDSSSQRIEFYFRDHQVHNNYQHPSFDGRVELRYPQMKDGGVSVVLKNVSINDTGTYECQITENGHQLVSTIHLRVEDSGEEAGETRDEEHEGDRVGEAVAVSVAVMQFAVIALVILRTVIKNLIHPPGQQTVALQQL